MTNSSGLPAGITGGRMRRDSARARLLARQLITTVLDFIFPPRCLQCKRVGSLLCAPCQDKIPVPLPIHEPGSPLDERRATAIFDGVIREAIHALKYQGQPRYAGPLGSRLVHVLNASGWQPTLIAAVPLHETRRRARGYNQSELLATPVAAACGLPFVSAALRRTRDTRAQVGLGARDRQVNVEGAFEAEPALVRDQRVVLIDDVYTTGPLCAPVPAPCWRQERSKSGHSRSPARHPVRMALMATSSDEARHHRAADA